MAMAPSGPPSLFRAPAGGWAPGAGDFINLPAARPPLGASEAPQGPLRPPERPLTTALDIFDAPLWQRGAPGRLLAWAPDFAARRPFWGIPRAGARGAQLRIWSCGGRPGPHPHAGQARRAASRAFPRGADSRLEILRRAWLTPSPEPGSAGRQAPPHSAGPDSPAGKAAPARAPGLAQRAYARRLYDKRQRNQKPLR
jgi:hypothetical protein